MTSPRFGSAWAFALAAFALVCIVFALVSSSVAPLPGAGFEERVTPGVSCEGVAATAPVREPFVREASQGGSRCIQWSASFVARDKMRARLEMMVAGDGQVSIDGRPVVIDHDAHPPRVRTGTIDLTKGVHSFEASFRARGAGEYFRLGMVDELAPHDGDSNMTDPLDADAFFLRASDAGDALSSPPRARPVWLALAASLALVLAGTFAWLAVRARRGLPLPRVDLSLAGGIFVAALFVRARRLDLQDICWDEGLISASRHHVRNLVLGDFYVEAWRYNYDHMPIKKWVLALGDLLGGLDGARIETSVLSALAVSLLFAFGRIAFGRRVGVVAGALAVVLPLWVAYGRIAGHESILLCAWTASMVALACWVESGMRDRLAAFLSVFIATIAVFTRPTSVWLFPVLVAGWLEQSRGTLLQRLRSFPLAALAGGVAAAALTYASWPFFWSDPAEKLARMHAFWAKPWGDIEVYMGKLRLPAAHYFVVAFLSETPALLLVLALAGAAIALRPGASRRWGIVCLCWLVFPFAQSVSTLRIGAGRYVSTAWPALLLFAAVTLVLAGDLLADLAFDLSRLARAAIRATPAALAVAYTGFALLHVEPYPLDYFNELVGGPSGVAARKMFEVPWWGEGNLAALRALNESAPSGARVKLALWPEHALIRLRDDLVQVKDPSEADYVLVSHLQYFAEPPSGTGCTRTARIDVAGAPLVDTYHCTPVSQVQLGFGAMNRPNGAGVAEAIDHFQDALRRDPNDAGALFGLGWAAHAKGDFPRAQALYTDAAGRAARAGDADIEYFARYDLGMLYAQHGDNDKAADAFRAALVVTERAPERFADRIPAAHRGLDSALDAIRRASIPIPADAGKDAR